ncbi:Uncharacterised protein [Mycobacteroides abscessus subsp. abscessus]|nr:Uncharacterised protein [Mycobacteroides abscessus subsp. abscessus]
MSVRTVTSRLLLVGVFFLDIRSTPCGLVRHGAGRTSQAFQRKSMIPSITVGDPPSP